MKLATILYEEKETASLITEGGALPMTGINRRFNKNWPTGVFELLTTGQFELLHQWYEQNKGALSDEMKNPAFPPDRIPFAPLYRHPRKIWGIGLNYAAHAGDLCEQPPQAEPASFMKPDTTIIGYNDTIQIPTLSDKTTGEAELGLIFSRRCKRVYRSNWRSVIAGFTAVIDMTAEDILRRNPRNLTQAKSFDTFFSFGPILYTLDEVQDLFQLNVQTVLNGTVFAENTVDRMTFPPDYLVAYHTQIMTMLPGDIISTGTPGAAPLKHNDRIECRIDDVLPLTNQVVDLKTEEANGFRT